MLLYKDTLRVSSTKKLISVVLSRVLSMRRYWYYGTMFLVLFQDLNINDALYLRCDIVARDTILSLLSLEDRRNSAIAGPKPG